MDSIEKLKEIFEDFKKRVIEICKRLSDMLKSFSTNFEKVQKKSNKKYKTKERVMCEKMHKNRLKRHYYIPVKRKKLPNQRRNI